MNKDKNKVNIVGMESSLKDELKKMLMFDKSISIVNPSQLDEYKKEMNDFTQNFIILDGKSMNHFFNNKTFTCSKNDTMFSIKTKLISTLKKNNMEIPSPSKLNSMCQDCLKHKKIIL